MKTIARLALAAWLGAGICGARAQVPFLLNYQGKLMDGTNLYNGPATLRFRIHNNADPVESAFAHMTVTSTVTVVDGLYSTLIGDTNDTTNWSWIFDNSPNGWWLEVEINGTRILPRERIASVPFALMARFVPWRSIMAHNINYDAIYTDHIVDGTLLFSDFAQNGAASGQVIKWNGSAWVAANESGGGGATATCLWTQAGANVYRPAGNVGIGTASPAAVLHVATGNVVIAGNGRLGIGTTSPQAPIHVATGNVVIASNARLGIGTTTPTAALHVATGDVVIAASNARLGIGTAAPTAALHVASGNVVVTDGGRLGLGTGNPISSLHVAAGNVFVNPGRMFVGTTNVTDNRLYVTGSGSGYNLATARLENQSPAGLGLVVRTTSSDATALLEQHGAGNFLNCDAWDGTSNWRRVITMMKDGTVECKVLNITGGSDLSEGFGVARSDRVAPGMVMAIDAEHPGKLRVADRAYDRGVAGIVSGAGGIQPGVRMGQAGTLAEGDHPIALTGRAYCLADATYGPIGPGDLLTTSDTPGHAMKAGDPARTPGAVIGKAMSVLETGQGQVLVLIALQ